MTYDQEREENINGFHHAHLVEGQIDGPHHAMRSSWLPLLAVAATSQPTGSITAAWVEYQPAPGGSYIQGTSIPIGLPCKFHATVNANSGGGTTWAIVCTVVDLNGPALYDYHIASVSELAGNVNISFSDYLQNMHNTPWVMPTRNLNLSFRLFASFDSQPNQTLLQNGDPSLYY